MIELSQEFDIHPNQIKQWRDQLLEGAAIADIVARRHCDFGADPFLGFGDERAEITVADVGRHHHPALAVLAADLVRPFRQSEARDLFQHDRRRPRAVDRGCERHGNIRQRVAALAHRIDPQMAEIGEIEREATGDPTAHAEIVELLRQRSARAGVAGLLRDMMLSNPAPVLTLDEAARQLTVSARTLRRHLAQEGVSLRDLQEETREALAEELRLRRRVLLGERVEHGADVTAHHRSGEKRPARGERVFERYPHERAEEA